MASYNSVTSTPLVLDGHGTWDALFAGCAVLLPAALQPRSRSRGSRVLPSTALHDAHAGQLLPGGSCVCRAGKSQRDGRMIYRLSDFVYILFLFL